MILGELPALQSHSRAALYTTVDMYEGLTMKRMRWAAGGFAPSGLGRHMVSVESASWLRRIGVIGDWRRHSSCAT